MASPMHRISNNPLEVDEVLFNAAYFRWLKLAEMHRFSLLVCSCPSERLYHISKYKDCIEVATTMREFITSCKSCSNRHHKDHFLVPSKRTRKAVTHDHSFPEKNLERQCIF